MPTTKRLAALVIFIAVAAVVSLLIGGATGSVVLACGGEYADAVSVSWWVSYGVSFVFGIVAVKRF